MLRLPRTAAILAALAAAPATIAQTPGDLLDQTRRLQVVSAQQLEADVRLGLSEASRLADKEQAVTRYKELLARVEADKALPDDRRATLKRVLADRIRVAQTAAAAADEDEPANSKPAVVKPQAADAAKIKEGIAEVVELGKQGKKAEAEKQARELLAKHPDNVAVQVLNGVSTTAASLSEADAVRTEKESRRVFAMRDMDKSALPPIGDVEFPKDWKEKSERRLKAYGLSADEKAMLQTLAAPIQVEFKNSRLQDVMEYLSTRMNRTIILDKNALDEGQLTYDTPVTFSLKTPVATRTALRFILQQLNLTYVVRDGTIQVTNQVRAKDQMVTRSYYIGDLVSGTGTFGGATQFGLNVDHAQLAQNVQAIIEMIIQSVDPQSWQGRGGLGNVGYNIPTQSLIIRQSAEVHSMIRGSLNR
jgi:hypothetical protein